MSNKPYFNEFGEELPDSTPIAKPVRFNRPGSTLDEIRRNLNLTQALAAQEGLESFDEADDFEVGDDFDPSHPWAHEVDNLNAMYEEVRAKVRDAKQRGEIELQHDGTWRATGKTPNPSPPAEQSAGRDPRAGAGGSAAPSGAGGSAPAGAGQQTGSGPSPT